jgi:hypothetical protein
MRKEQLRGDDIFVVHDFLTADECRRFIAASEAVGYGDAPISMPGGPILLLELRNNERVMMDDRSTAEDLYARARPFLPASHDDWEPCGFNERFRYYRYTAGQKFEWHYDGEFHRDNGEQSKYTVMVYLNDACTGGETLFHLHEGSVTDDAADLRVRPSPGKALLFRHDVLHTGAVVTDGVKYVLRTDVMFRPRPAPAPVG